MTIVGVIKRISSNKVVLYLTSRYITYFIQFVNSLLIAQKLGPENLGIWGYYLLIYCYLTFITLGIPNSLNILTVQNKNNDENVQKIFDSSFISVIGLCVLITFFCVGYYGVEDKYNLSIHTGLFIFIIGAIAVMNQVNTLYATMYRVRNKLFGMAFHQSAAHFIMLIVVLFVDGKNLLIGLLMSYFLGELFSFLIFKKGNVISFKKKISIAYVKLVLNKGFYLFIYNTGFYFILLTTRSLIQTSYMIEEFGFFTFSYTIANSVLLLLQAFTTIIFPKLIDKYKTEDSKKVIEISNLLLDTNVTLSYTMVLLAIPCIPLLLYLMPQYQSTYDTISFTALTVLLYNNAVYGSFLMAHNKEKFMALVAVVSLSVNILMSLFLINIVHVRYCYVVFAMMASYFIYSYMITMKSYRLLGKSYDPISVIKGFLPYRLLLPFILEILLIIFNPNPLMLLLNLILFCTLNIKQFIKIAAIIKTIIIRPQIVDINN